MKMEIKDTLSFDKRIRQYFYIFEVVFKVYISYKNTDLIKKSWPSPRR